MTGKDLIPGNLYAIVKGHPTWWDNGLNEFMIEGTAKPIYVLYTGIGLGIDDPNIGMYCFLYGKEKIWSLYADFPGLEDAS